jgi:hypothetical protein
MNQDNNHNYYNEISEAEKVIQRLLDKGLTMAEVNKLINVKVDFVEGRKNG